MPRYEHIEHGYQVTIQGHPVVCKAWGAFKGTETETEMLAAGFRQLPDVQSVILTPEQQTQILMQNRMTEAERLMVAEDCQAAVGAILTRIGKLMALGVTITDWTFESVIKSTEKVASESDTTTAMILTQHGSALLTEWIRLVYHCDSDFVKADDLWGYFYTIFVKLHPEAKID